MHARHLEEERYLNEQIDVLHIEKQNLQEMVVKLQKTLAAMEADVRDAEVSTVKLKKDKTSLKRSLNKVCLKEMVNAKSPVFTLSSLH